MRLTSRILAFSLCAALPAAEAPVEVLDLSVPAMQRVLADWNASIYGTEWADRGSDPLRARLRAWTDSFAQEHGIDPFAALAACRSLRARVGIDSPAEAPWVHIQADVGDQAAALFAVIAKRAEAVPGDADALVLDPEGSRIAVRRSGSQLTISSEGAKPAAIGAYASGRGIDLVFDGPALAKAMRAAPDQVPAGFPIERYLPLASGAADVVDQGLAATWRIQADWTWLRPVDLRALARLPATVTDLNACAIDGPALWKEMIAPAIAAAKPADPDALLKRYDPQATWQELVTGLSGTWAIAITPSSPMPGYTLVAPRSPALDRLAERLVTANGATFPAEGGSAPIVLPAGVPVMLTLVRDAKSWVLTTDPALAPAWLAADPVARSWLATPLGAVAAERGAGACAVGVTDTAAQLRTYMTLAGIGLAAVPQATPAERQAVLALLGRLASRAKPGWTTLKPAAGGFAGEASGAGVTNGGVGVFAVMAAIAVPNLLESRVTANEMAAASSLKSGVFPAQIQFQAGGYRDTDNDGVGEYCDRIQELAGEEFQVAGGGPRKLSLLFKTYAADPAVVNGYRFAVHAFGEKGFVGYAIPVDRKQGRKMFAVTENGQVQERALPREIPAPDRFLLWDGRTVASSEEPPAAGWKPQKRR